MMVVLINTTVFAEYTHRIEAIKGELRGCLDMRFYVNS